MPDQWPDGAQLAAYVAGVQAQLLAAVRQGVGGSAASAGMASTAGSNGGCHSSEGTPAAPVSMHALCMVVDHERQHQETLCYMLAQQRKADAAAAAAGRPAVLAPPGSKGATPGGACQQPADAVLPFYLQQCSYASASTSMAAAVVAAAPAVAPSAPATPAKAERLPFRLAGLHLHTGPAAELVPIRPPHQPSGGSEKAPAGFVHVPGGEVGRLVLPQSTASRCPRTGCQVGSHGCASLRSCSM